MHARSSAAAAAHSNPTSTCMPPTPPPNHHHPHQGWVLFVTGLHEEAQEEDVVEAFAEAGDVRNVYLNLDRQTGYVKGYALIEYATEKEAREAVSQLDGTKLLEQTIQVTWAFVKQGRGGARRGGKQ
jgi:RNA-binding protein 8A